MPPTAKRGAEKTVSAGRVKFAVTGFVLLCLLSTGRFASHPPEVDLRLGTKLTVSQYDHRFEKLRRALPDSGVIGYIGEGPTSPYELPNYYLTQYSLAPLVVDHSPDHALVVGNFPISGSMPKALWPPNLTRVQDFGDGVMLLAKRDER